MVELVSFILGHRDGSLKEKLINRINHPSDDVRILHSFIVNVIELVDICADLPSDITVV